MPVEHDAVTIGSLLRDADRQKLVLPNFQREYVWALDAQKRLIASLLADVPIGAVLLLQGEPEDYASRRIALMLDATPTAECIYLLDGQQRLSTVAAALASPFSQSESWRAIFDALPAKLRYIWRLRAIPGPEEDDIFGYKGLSFPDRLDVEPDELANFLAPARVLVKEEHAESAWYHPNWKTDLSPNERTVQIARAAASEGMVPLWGLAHEEQVRLVDTTLQVIAGHRRVDLRAGANFDERPELYESLRRADPTLPTDWGDASPNQIEQAFSSLAERWRTAMSHFVQAMLVRQTPSIRLQREDVARAVAIFEVINQGGTPLTPFDLIVAKNARDPLAANLSQMLVHNVQTEAFDVTQAAWFEPGSSPQLAKWSTEARDICVSSGSLTSAFKNSFLNLLSIQHHSANQDPGSLEVTHIKRKAILAVPASGIASGWKQVADALLRSWAFLQVRCGIRGEADLRYKLMILPIAYSVLRLPDRWDERSFYDQLEFWYWSALFGGVFRERQNENAINELKLLYKWLTGDSAARDQVLARQTRVLSVPGYSDKDTLLLRDDDATISSDVSSAILQYVLSLGPMDFDPDEPKRLFPWQDVELEDHHVVPLASAITLRESASELRTKGDGFILNSPLNRTLISRHANREIGAKTPAQYWAQLRAHQPTSHLLPGVGSLPDLLPGGQWEAGVKAFLEQRYGLIRDSLLSELTSLSA